MLGQARALTILQVEDGSSDAYLTADALRLSGTPHVIHLVTSGRAALEFLHQEHEFARAPRPDLVLLDLGLPDIGGQEVLARIRADVTLDTIPVVIFTSEDTEESKQTAYALHVNSYVVKPMEFSAFKAAINSIASYWSAIAQEKG
jgi:CheY-like chemotaxis protein